MYLYKINNTFILNIPKA